MAVARDADGASDAFEARLPVRDDRERVTLRQLERAAAGRRASRSPPSPSRGAAGNRAARGPGLRSAGPRADGGRPRLPARLSVRLHRAAAEPRARRPRAARLPRRCTPAKSETRDGPRGRGHPAVAPDGRRPNGLVRLLAGRRRATSRSPPGRWSSWSRRRRPAIRSTTSCWRNCTRTLEQALRSDYGRFIDGEAFAERAWRSDALAAPASPNPAYAAELAREPQFLDLEARRAGPAGLRRPGQTSRRRRALAQKLWDGVVIRLLPGPGDLRRPAGAGGRRSGLDPAQRDAHRGRGDARRADARPAAARHARPAPAAAGRRPGRRSDATTAGARPTPTPRRSWRSPRS